ncbi:uncharacterized protein PRCAT00001970001 [Priceomyces carsonii]|uniref:uncharacterized protein n=1 Tax=Priceomyces carsonii TaxID=28549 RepID=UPI002ED7EC4E|nr:unnamed protein product [Priceomyces carsonii]
MEQDDHISNDANAISSPSLKYVPFKVSDIKKSLLSNKDGLLVLISGFICNFMVFGIGFTYGVFQEYYTSSNGPLSLYSDSKVAIIGTLSTGLTYIFGIFNKSLMKYSSPKTVMFVGSIIMSLGLILAGFCNHIYQFILTQGVMFGIGSSLVYLPPVVCAPPFFTQHRAIAMGFLFSGTGFGSLAISSLSRFLIAAIGWRWCLRVLGLINLIFTIFASFIVVVPEGMNFKEGNKVISLGQLKSWKAIFICLGGLFQSAGYLIPLIYMSKMAKTLNFTNSQGALFIGVNNGVNAIFKIILGYAGDKLGRMNTIIACSVVSAVTILGLLGTVSRDSYISFVVFYGVFSGVIVSLLPTCLVELFGIANYQAMSGLMYFSRGIGNMLGSPLAGLMISNDGLSFTDYKFPILYNGLLLVASASCLAVLRVVVSAERQVTGWKF